MVWNRVNFDPWWAGCLRTPTWPARTGRWRRGVRGEIVVGTIA